MDAHTTKDFRLSKASSLTTKPLGSFTVDGLEPAFAAARLYSGLRKPADEDLFVRLISWDEGLDRICKNLAYRFEVEYDDLKQQLLISMLEAMRLRRLPITEETAFYSHVSVTARHISLRHRSLRHGGVSLDALEESGVDWREHPVFSDEKASVDQNQSDLHAKQAAAHIQAYIVKMRAKATPKKKTPPGTVSKLTGHSQMSAIARVALDASKARQMVKPEPAQRTNADGTVVKRKGRPPGPSSVAQRRTPVHDELFRLYKESKLPQQEYADMLGISKPKLNKLLSAKVSIGDDVMERARLASGSHHEEIKEISARYAKPMSEIFQMWGMEIAGRLLNIHELSDAAVVTLSTIRRWKNEKFRPSTSHLARVELRLRRHFGKAH